jgi:FkbM family methyltransferase
MMLGHRPSNSPPGTAVPTWPLGSAALRFAPRLPSVLTDSKQVLRRLFEKLTGTRIYRTPPRGVDRFADIENSLPNLQVNIVFDVGANVGQSARSFRANFPDAKIYSFEPVDTTYRRLERELRGYANIQTSKLALGAESGPGTMVLEGISEMHFLRRNASGMPSGDAPVEDVAVETLDNFCRSQGIERINYLKIDTEGADLDVLIGAEAMLRAQQVDLIEAECGMNGRNKRHVGLDILIRFLEERNYLLFGIYEQVNEWPTRAPNLRRANPIFISENVVRTNIAPSIAKA